MKKIAILIGAITLWCNTYSQNTDDLKTHSLKYDFFSPVSGCFGFSLETTRSNFTSLDIDAGLIGLKLGDYFLYDKFAGGYVAGGPRFYFKKDQEMVENNNMKGAYFKPLIMANFFTFEDVFEYYDFINDTTIGTAIKGNDFSLSLLLALGNQWVLSDMVTFDIWFGLGYGGSWVNDNSDEIDPLFDYYESPTGYKFSYVKFGDSPLIFDGGLSIGILLK